MSESRTRRDLLQKAAGTAAAVTVLSKAAAAEESLEDPRPVPRAAQRAALADGEPLRMAVVGTGGMGTAHVTALARLVSDGKANVRVEALCDICDPRPAAAKEQLGEIQPGGVATDGDYRQLLARRDLHAVLVATPEHAGRAAARGGARRSTRAGAAIGSPPPASSVTCSSTR